MRATGVREVLGERGVFVDHTSIFRWVIRLTPQLEAEFGRRKAPVGRWRLDETYVKVKAPGDAQMTAAEAFYSLAA